MIQFTQKEVLLCLLLVESVERLVWFIASIGISIPLRYRQELLRRPVRNVLGLVQVNMWPNGNDWCFLKRFWTIISTKGAQFRVTSDSNGSPRKVSSRKTENLKWVGLFSFSFLLALIKRKSKLMQRLRDYFLSSILSGRKFLQILFEHLSGIVFVPSIIKDWHSSQILPVGLAFIANLHFG